LAQISFGIALPSVGSFASPEAILEVAQVADDLCYHSIWAEDHISFKNSRWRSWHVSCGTEDGLGKKWTPDMFEAITVLSALSLVTKNVMLGTGVIGIPKRNPILLAKQLATLHHLSNNRLIFGYGVGGPQEEFEALSCSYHERGRITDEYFQLIRLIWSLNRKEISFDGKYIDMKSATFYPKADRIPAWLGGNSLAGIRRAAKYADGWLPFWSPSEYRETKDILLEEIRKYGKNARTFTFGTSRKFCVQPTSNKAMELSKSSFESWFASSNSSFEAIMHQHITGSPAEVTRKIEEYASLGVNFIHLVSVSPDLRSLIEMMRLFAREVMPSFR
jgi:probable F420-dependent oxidoreductase